jgi:hypothetical protein
MTARATIIVPPDQQRLGSEFDARLTELECFAATHRIAQIDLHGVSVCVFSSATNDVGVLDAVFGSQARVTEPRFGTDAGWRVGAIGDDAFYQTWLRLYEEYLAGPTTPIEVKRWGGDSLAAEVRPAATAAIIKHDRPFRGLSVFSEPRRLAVYLRPASEQLNIPHFEHLSKYALRVQHWRQGKLEVHGAACSYRGRGILLMGFRRSGKTTLAMHLLSRGGLIIGSDLALLASDRDWFVEAVPHMCRITRETIADNVLLERALRPFAGNRDYLKGPVFFDAKFELYANAMNIVFSRQMQVPKSRIDAVLFPRFSLDARNHSIRPMTPPQAASLVRERLLTDKPLPDWLPFTEVLQRESLQRPALERLIATLPRTAAIEFGKSNSFDWTRFDADFDGFVSGRT